MEKGWDIKLLWLYWCGHVAFALVHQLSGDNVFGAIFALGRRQE